MRKVSEHFSLEEFRCHDGTPYPEEWVDDRLPALLRTLEAIRAEFGKPIHVVCGYRTVAYNRYLREKGLKSFGKSGVAVHSQHCEGRAADFSIFGEDPRVVFSTVIRMHEHGQLPELGGIELYTGLGFVHVDTFKAPDGKLRRW